MSIHRVFKILLESMPNCSNVHVIYPNLMLLQSLMEIISGSCTDGAPHKLLLLLNFFYC